MAMIGGQNTPNFNEVPGSTGAYLAPAITLAVITLLGVIGGALALFN